MAPDLESGQLAASRAGEAREGAAVPDGTRGQARLRLLLALDVGLREPELAAQQVPLVADDPHEVRVVVGAGVRSHPGEGAREVGRVEELSLGQPSAELDALLAVDREAVVHERALGELLLSGRVAPLAVVLGLPLAEPELQPGMALQRHAEVVEARRRKVVLEVVLDPRPKGVAAELDPGAADREAGLVRLCVVLGSLGVGVEGRARPELQAPAELHPEVAVGALDDEAVVSVGDGRLRGRRRLLGVRGRDGDERQARGGDAD